MTLNKKTTTGKNGKEYTNLNVYLNYVNRLNDQLKGLSTGFIPYADIPGPEKEEDEDLGSSWNWKPVDKFYAKKIKELQEKLNIALQVPAPAAPLPIADNIMEPDSDDDLPF